MHDLPGEWTLDDLDLLPDDGHRYEIVDGSLYTSPPPLSRYQLAAARLGDVPARGGATAVRGA